MLQFAGELYGPLSAAGLSYWALGEGNYWGHNAIIRVAPFAELCGLPLLSGRAPLGGEIMSHDFVEAALLRRGGWQVWIADDIGESYEEPPPSIADFATRDRRWCQGNMQHIKVLFVRDLHWVSRLHLAIGILSYLTSPLWLLFLLLSAAQAWELTYGEPVYFTAGWPFPTLPVSVSAEAALLLVVTLGLLFAAQADGPAARPDRRAAAARARAAALRLIASALLETLLSALVAPIMMLLHTSFVADDPARLGDRLAAAAAAGRRRPAGRKRAPVRLGDRARRRRRDRHASSYTPSLFYWLIPVFAGPGPGHPARGVDQLRRMGRAGWRRAGLLRVVEETRPAARHAPARRAARRACTRQPADRFALVDARSRLQRAAYRDAAGGGRLRARQPADGLRAIERKAVYLGAAALSKPERRALLESPSTMAACIWPPGCTGAATRLAVGNRRALAEAARGARG